MLLGCYGPLIFFCIQVRRKCSINFRWRNILNEAVITELLQVFFLDLSVFLNTFNASFVRGESKFLYLLTESKCSNIMFLFLCLILLIRPVISFCSGFCSLTKYLIPEVNCSLIYSSEKAKVFLPFLP